MRSLFALFMLSGIVMVDGSTSFFKPPQPTYLIVPGQVKINLADGSMEFEPGYSPDTAVRQFWEAMSEDYRRMLRWKATHPEEKD